MRGAFRPTLAGLLILIMILSLSGAAGGYALYSKVGAHGTAFAQQLGSVMETVYWLKLSGLPAHSSETIYMGFASPSVNLLNGVDVGEAPQLSPSYGQYDDGKSVFLYYTNFTSLQGWEYNISKGTVSAHDGLSVNFNGPGYVVTNASFGPGTAFLASITKIGDVDDVGYFDPNVTVNGGTGWAGAFIRLACGNTYPDQWNSSGEANGCGSVFGYFINQEGVSGTYEVEVLNRTSSLQIFNGITGRVINRNYPSYPARVGFDGAYSPMNVQWAAVIMLPPNGVMPSATPSTQVYPVSQLGVSAPPGITYAVPINITNSQGAPTPSVYQQQVIVNSSIYTRYEAPNLQNVEFFYPNGTVIPSWLESGNSNTAGLQATLVIRVTPSMFSMLLINGTVEQLNSSGYFIMKDASPGTYTVLAENPYYRWFFREYSVKGGLIFINISLKAPSAYHGEDGQYPWVQVGPAYISNPIDSSGDVFTNASGHIGLIQIDPLNQSIIYIASGSSEGAGPMGAGGVYETTDGGNRWYPRDYGLPYGIISGFYMDPLNPSVLLVAYTNNGIYRTDDGGLWWYKVANYTDANSFQYTSGVIFAGSDQGVLESEDQGLTWNLTMPSQYPVTKLSASGSSVYAFVWGPGAPGPGLAYLYFMASTDLGKNWTTLHTFIGNYPMFISASPFNSSFVYLGYASSLTTNSSFFSIDGGRDLVPLGFNPKYVVFDPLNRSIIWSYGPGVFYYSFNGGKSFKEGPPATDNMGLCVDPKNDSMLVLGSDQGVYESNDLGRSWRSINGDLSDALTYSVSVGGNGSVIAVGMQDYSAFFSWDGGQSWLGGNTQPIPIGGESTYITVNPYNSSWMYAYSFSSGLSVSGDGGFTFKSVGAPPGYLVPPASVYVDPYNRSMVFAAVGELYNGTGFGERWAIWQGAPQSTTTIVMPSNGKFLVGTTDGIYYNFNGTWERSLGINDYVSSIAVDPANSSIIIASTGLYEPSNLYISNNGGRSFSLLRADVANPAGGLFGIPCNVYWLNTTGYPIIATTVNNGVLISLDEGKTWYPINYNLRSGEVTSAYFCCDTLYISTYGEGVLKWPNFSVSSLPATVNGYTSQPGARVSVNGSAVGVYEGHWRAFLKPGNYVISVTAPGLNRTYYVNLAPLETYNISTATPVPQNYSVTFTESGLPAGTQWSVSVDGINRSGTSSLVFYLPAGVYSYSSYAKNYLSPSGTVMVNGATQINLRFGSLGAPPPVQPENETYRIASDYIMVDAIAYGDGCFMIGGVNATGSPLLMLLNGSSVIDLSGYARVAGFSQVTSLVFYDGQFYIGGTPSGSAMPFASYSPYTNSFEDLGQLLKLSSQANVYALAAQNGEVYVGGYLPYQGGLAFLYSFNISADSFQNCTSYLPADAGQVLALASNGTALSVNGITYNGPFSEVVIPGSSVLRVALPPSTHAITAALPYEGGFLLGGGDDEGGELLWLSPSGKPINFSSGAVSNEFYEILSLAQSPSGVIIGGWGVNGSNLAVFNQAEGSSVLPVSNGIGSEVLAVSWGNGYALVGGTISVQEGNSSGAILERLYPNYTAVDLTGIMPKSYIEESVGYPKAYFYVYASPNYVELGMPVHIYGQALPPGVVLLSFNGERYTFEENGSFVATFPSGSPGDHLISLNCSGTLYYNYYVVLYSYPYLYPGATMPHNSYFGYSHLEYGGAVRYGNYVEFIMVLQGPSL